MTFSVGVLTISDSAAKDASSDRSGPFIVSQLQEERPSAFRVAKRKIVADDVDAIRLTIQAWVDGNDGEEVHLIICTGGTGFGVRDVTPEAVSPLFTKQTPGLTHALTQHSLAQTPFAALSRMVTGIRKNCLIVTLPGSPKAVRECLQLLLDEQTGVLLHALELLGGGSGEAQHKEMQQGEHRAHKGEQGTSAAITGTETDTGRSRHLHAHGHQGHHHHHHHHGHHHHAPKPRTAQDESAFRTHDPSQSVALRNRTSPYPIITLKEALDLILTVSQVNEAVERPVNAELRGYLLAEAVSAPRSLPPKPTTNVDGYAINAKETAVGAYPVVTRGGKLLPGSVYRINTGQGLPDGADAVLMVEDSDLLEEQDGEEKTIQVKAQIDVGENVRKAGSDVREGQIVLEKGVKLSDIGGEIGTLAFLGRDRVQVIRKPRIAVLSTGNELFDVERSSTDGQSKDAWDFRVFDANRPSLSAALRGAGFEVVDLGIVGDRVEDTLQALRRGIEEADVIISSGGTSMGESDLLKPLIERQIENGKIHFGRVAMKPGKPTTFATATSQKDGKQRLLFALPGNPASAMVCLFVFVMPALRKLSGYALPHCQLPRVTVKLQDELRCDPRPEFHRVIITTNKDGQLQAQSTGMQRSSGMHSMATANGLVCVPSVSADGPRSLAKGSSAEAILLGSIA